jgi:P4 family phage/plasmid primase-like protien
MVKVKFIKNTGVYKIGEIIACSKSEADEIVALGDAEICPEDVKGEINSILIDGALKMYKSPKSKSQVYNIISELGSKFTEEEVISTIEKHYNIKFKELPELKDESGPAKLHCSKCNGTEFIQIKTDDGYGWVCNKCNKERKEPTKNFKKASKLFSGKMELAERFFETQPIYYDFAGIWWLWDNGKRCWEMTDEVTITNFLYLSLNVDTINTKERTEIIQALKQVGRMNRPLPLPKTYIQFKDKLVDILNGDEKEATSEYFTLNPIPYKLHKERFIETPKMDKIFEEWVGKEHVKTLHQIIAYCLLPDYPIHRLFCFIGGGMNGKSCFLRLLEKFLGNNNVCSTELDVLLHSRFELTRLYKKLACMMGETNFNEMSKTSILKKLTGQDLIGFEYKNKNPFDERNYAKILISTNNLPETTDKTIGFYRRWLIIDFPNSFSEEKDILSEIPEEEYEALAVKCCLLILPELLKERKFYNEGDIAHRQKNYEEKSNPFDKFYKERIDEDPSKDIPKWEFEKIFNEWCRMNKFREMSDISIASKMKEKGIQETRLWKDWYENSSATKKQFRCWSGITWKI